MFTAMFTLLFAVDEARAKRFRARAGCSDAQTKPAR